MPVTRWKVRHIGHEWGADGQTITPEVFADAVRDHVGERHVTYYGKPYVLDPADPQSVYDFFDSEVDRAGERVLVLWEHTAGPDTGDAVP